MSSTPPEGYPPYPPGSGPTSGYARPSEMPGSVATAVKLIWASMALSVVASLLTLTMLDTIIDRAIQQAAVGTSVNRDSVRAAAISGAVFELIVGLGLTFLLLTFIRRGANWARIVYTVLGALGLIFGLLGLGGQPPLLLVLSVVSLALTAAILLFLWKSESNPWFVKRTA
jgi:hypothetical protein